MVLKNYDIELLNRAGEKGDPFLFIIDFECKTVLIFSEEEAIQNDILFDLGGYSNYTEDIPLHKEIIFKSTPPPYDDYLQKFEFVSEQLEYGNSFLLNLTVQSPVNTNLSLKEIFLLCKVPFKLLFKNEFVVFSPESFIRIKDSMIYSYPMKGTIDASIENAEQLILANKKETAEHATIVDLIRNDLSRVAKDISVSRYRFISEINSQQKKLLQVSSEIKGTLTYNFPGEIGTILSELLPAGSVTGAPKKKTMEIIKSVESPARGFYTGVFGYFNGIELHSAVMIRYIENIDGKKFYRSGGGITVYSQPEKEYQEIIDKIYVPIT